MPVINIHEARREGARTVTALAGVSGSGKTYTAIQYAYGLAGFDAGKVGLLDTENRRGSLYCSILEGATTPTKRRFLIGDLAAPFSPSRYADAMREFESAGVEVLVVDSISHSWEGVGGCEEIATQGDPKFPRWNLAKRENRKMVNYMLQCPMHIVLCVRAREKVKVGAGGSVTPLGIQPVAEKNLLFEATISVMLADEGRSYSRTKVPADLLQHFPGTTYITAQTGNAVKQWVDGGGEVNPAVEKYRNRLLTVAEQGVRYIETAWAKVPKDIQTALGDSFYSELEASARAFDEQRSLGEELETVTAINNSVSPAIQGQRLSFED